MKTMKNPKRRGAIVGSKMPTPSQRALRSVRMGGIGGTESIRAWHVQREIEEAIDDAKDECLASHLSWTIGRVKKVKALVIADHLAGEPTIALPGRFGIPHQSVTRFIASIPRSQLAENRK